MNHLVIYCTANDIPLPVLDQNLIYNTFNFCPEGKGFNSIKNEHLWHIVKVMKDIFPNPSDGDAKLRGALIGHLVVQYSKYNDIYCWKRTVLCYKEKYHYSFEDLSSRIGSLGAKEYV
jgi:hypothetical protein